MDEQYMTDHDRNRLAMDISINSLRNVLKLLRSASKPELSRLTGIEEPLTDRLVSELCEGGEFFEEAALDDSGQILYRFNGEYRLILAICVLEKNRVVIAVSNLYGEYLERDAISASPDTLAFFDNIVEIYKARYPAIGLLAFGMAGFEVRGSGRLLSINFPNLEWVHFRDHFTEKYGLSAILENDIKAAAAGFYETRDFGEDKCVGAVYVPRTHHPATGICIDGKIYRGRDNASGEVIFLETDVKWQPFTANELDYSNVDMLKLLADIARPMIVFLNPDCVVLYGDQLPLDTAEQLRKRLLESMPREFLPEIVFIPDIIDDFLDGLVHLALKTLEPKIDLTY
jgi:predicted NBD/HSP70 family sugar kinase